MKIINLLHFYQPPNQQYDILDRIVNESYRPILKGLVDRPLARVVINISGGLTQLLIDNKYDDVLERLKLLIDREQIEVADSAKYHAFLPLLPRDELIRQIEQNNKLNKDVFGSRYNPKGFFPPELAVSNEVVKVVSDLGYEWLAAPELAYGGGFLRYDKLYKDSRTGVGVFFRNKRVSAMILAATVRSAEDLYNETKDLQDTQKYFFTVMDVETFGHHRVGHERLLFEILDYRGFETITVSDLLLENFDSEEVDIRASTWTNEEQDFWLDKERKKTTEAKSYILWKDPSNPIHKLQWELVDLCVETINSPEYNDDNKVDAKWKLARNKLDIALASDQFWWASAKPWWSLEMIESGAYALKDVILTLDPDSKLKGKVDLLYRQILSHAFEWQRTGYIRKKHLEDSTTHMKEPFSKRAPAEWYNQIVLEFEDEMMKAAEKRDYEKAIKWRDALTKLKLGTDIYDVLHVVDELWSARQIPSVKPFLLHDWDELSAFAKKYFKDVKEREEFVKWARKRSSN